MDVGIVGAGLLGRLIGWQLLREGHQVTLFDRDNADGEACAGRVAAAMLAPFSEAVCCEPEILKWGLEGLAHWPVLLKALQADSGQETYFQQRGSIVVAHAQDLSNLQHFNQLLQAKLGDHHPSIRYLDKAALQLLEPSLATTFQQGTFLQEEGCLDNWGLLDNLLLAIRALGGECHHRVDVSHVDVGQVTVNDETQAFDWVIDTRGMGAKADLPTLRGVRGEVLWVHAPDVDISRPIRLMHPRYQLYIAPKPNQVFVIGATEIESESMAAMTVRSSLELQSALYSVHTGFAEANIMRAYAHCRPAFMDNLPRIETTPGLMRINGLYRHGYLLGPVVIAAALRAIEGDYDMAFHKSV